MTLQPWPRGDARDPDLLILDWHELGASQPEWLEAAPLDPDVSEDLSAFCAAGWLTALGFVIGSAIAFAIDAHGAWLTLAAFMGA